jgi:SAM-dependent methyltransferase
MIVDAIVYGLKLNISDTLLDLCCGNGALSSLLFKYCKAGFGVDFSEYLISIANHHFAIPPEQTYLLQDVVSFCENPIHPNAFSKAVCYGSFAYIEPERAETMLRLLNNNFHNLESVYIGNCPDKSLLPEFVENRHFPADQANNPDSPIGVWRTQEEFKSLARRCGWRMSIHKMPRSFYAAHYRYDVILKK